MLRMNDGERSCYKTDSSKCGTRGSVLLLTQGLSVEGGGRIIQA